MMYIFYEDYIEFEYLVFKLNSKMFICNVKLGIVGFALYMNYNFETFTCILLQVNEIFLKHSVMAFRKLFLLYFENTRNCIFDINLNLSNLIHYSQLNIILT